MKLNNQIVISTENEMFHCMLKFSLSAHYRVGLVANFSSRRHLPHTMMMMVVVTVVMAIMTTAPMTSPIFEGV